MATSPQHCCRCSLWYVPGRWIVVVNRETERRRAWGEGGGGRGRGGGKYVQKLVAFAVSSNSMDAAYNYFSSFVLDCCLLVVGQSMISFCAIQIITTSVLQQLVLFGVRTLYLLLVNCCIK